MEPRFIFFQLSATWALPLNGFIVDCTPSPSPSAYLALRADDQVRRFINIHLHYITTHLSKVTEPETPDNAIYMTIRLKMSD